MSDELPPPSVEHDVSESSPSKPFWKRWWVITIAVLVVLGVVGAVFGENADEAGSSRPSSQHSSPAITGTTAKPVATTTATSAPLPTSTTPAPTSTVVVASTSPATSSSLAPSTSSTAPPPEKTESICFDETNDGAGNFDLLEASITKLADGSGYFFVATAIGPDEGRDVGLTFGLPAFGTFEDPGNPQYVVSGGAYEDGYVDNYLADLRTNEEAKLDDAFYADLGFSVVLTNEQISRVAGTDFDWDIVLTVDGVDVDECVVAAFGVTGAPK